MATLQPLVPKIVYGSACYLGPLASISFQPGGLPCNTADDSDIRALIQALPMKTDIEALTLQLEQHCREFQQIHSDV